MAIYFLSDVHLGHDDPDTEASKLRKLDGLLETITRDGERLYILGDLFDFWFEYKHAIPKDHMGALCRLSKLIESGIGITYITGNHDFWLGNLLTEQFGIDVHRDELVAEHDGCRILMTHGDGLARDDRAYRILKRIVRNRFNIFLYRQIPPDIGIPLAKWCSRMSRGRSSVRPKDTFVQEYRDFAEGRLVNGYDCVICAHTHFPEKIEFEQGIYINTGDWYENFTYATLRDGQFELKWWEEADR